MFINFFFYMKDRGLKVSFSEWMTLMEALGKGLAGSSFMRFYHLCRSICIKSEAKYDLYDQCFAEFFKDVEADDSLLEKVMDWLDDPKLPRQLTEAELEMIQQFDLDELREMFEQRLAEQKERHDGGNRWVGTGGTSPFGNSGVHPGGIRVGGESRGRSASMVASQRRFRNLRNDLTLDVRQISMALRQLRRLSRQGRLDELDLDATIDETAKNAGDIEIIFRPERKNNVKLLLLMDVGGSMTPYSRLCSQLFSAAHSAKHFKAFKYYYFHNCPYETLFTDISRYKGEPTKDILQQLDKDWFCIIVGDAAMGPYELTTPGGSVDYFHNNSEAGITWLHRIQERFPRSVWLNPDPPNYWDYTLTVRMIREVFPMYALTLAGLEEAVARLRKSPGLPLPNCA